jgi:hypothetical protein
MEESGPRLNRDRLANAHQLARSLAQRPFSTSRRESRPPRRAGAVQDAVIRALASAGRPLRAREVHAAAEELAATSLSWNTVKDCLHKNARRPGSPVERVGHGWYRSASLRVAGAGGARSRTAPVSDDPLSGV